MSELVWRRRNLSFIRQPGPPRRGLLPVPQALCRPLIPSGAELCLFIGMLKLQAGYSFWERLSLGLVGWDWPSDAPQGTPGSSQDPPVS